MGIGQVREVIVCFADFEFDQTRLQLRKAGRVVKAEAIAMRVLDLLLQRAGEIVTKDEIIDEVWEGRAVADNVLTVAMARLRKALKSERKDDEYVLTVYGRGYRFVAPCVTREAPPPELALSAGGERLGSQFVGRERVIERLEHALTAAQAGRGRMCVLIGEAGIGKTRAVEALEQKLAGSAVQTAWGFCREVGDTPPLAPFRRLLDEISLRSGEPALTPLLATLHELLRPLEVLPAIPDGKDDALGPQRETRHQSFALFARAFSEAARERPWILVLDDLHRADAASLELLSFLIEEIAHARILIVATLRHAPGRRSPRPDTHLPYVLGHRNCERIALERLREVDVARYVATLVEDGDGRLARAVFERSEGNPFFMTELSRQLADMEQPDTAQLAIPDVALDLIRQRVANLSEGARTVLSAAAVIGRTFELALLQATTGGEMSALMTNLDEAIAADLVGAAADSTTAFAFGHDLIRSLLFDALSLACRRRWHVRSAAALEQQLALGASVAPSELAYHLHAALPDSDLRKTVAFCRAASAAAASVYAHSDVVRYLLHALEALGLMERPSMRLRISMWYVIALYSLGLPLSLRALAEVARLAKEQGNALMLVRAAIMLNAYPGLKPIGGARAALDDAGPLIAPHETALRSAWLAALACTTPNSFDKRRSEQLLGEAYSLAFEADSQAARYVALVVQFYLQGGPEHHDRGPTAAEELTRLHGPRVTPRMAVAPLHVALFRAVHALQSGNVASMNAAIQHGLTHAREIRHLLGWHFRRFQAIAAINRGALAEGVPALVVLQRSAEKEMLWGAEPFCAFDRIVIFRELAEEGPALDDALRAALDYASDEPPSLWSVKVRALATVGLGEEARAMLALVAPSELAALPCDSQYLGTLGHLTHAALLLDERHYLEALHPLLQRFPQSFAAHYSFLSDAVPQLLAQVCTALGRHAEAVSHAQEGLRMNERAGFTRSVVEARLCIARSQLARNARGDREAALKLAREAQRSAARIGMRQTARAASALLSEHEGR